MGSIPLHRYRLITDFSRNSHKLGGVALYVEDSAGFEIEVVDVENYCIELVCEAVLTKITTKKHSFYILGVYRPPNGQSKLAIEIMASILSKVQAENKQILLMGDVNFDRLTENLENNHFEEELSTFGVVRLPLPATRITSTSKSSIDAICTNMPEDKVKFRIHQTGLSDHTGQLSILQLERNIPQTTQSEYRRHFTKQNLDNLKAELIKEDWDGVHKATDVEVMYSSFYKIVKSILDQTCPNKRSRTKQKPMMKIKYSAEAKLLKEDFLRAVQKYEMTGSDADRQQMNHKKKTYDLELRNLKRNASTEHIRKSDNKSKALWNVINTEKQAKTPLNPSIQLEINGKVENNPNLISEHLNKYFSEIADITLKKQNNKHRTTPLVRNLLNVQQVETMKFTPTNTKEVIETIRSLKSKLSSGLDEVPSKVVKYCAGQLATPLACIINKSFEQGYFPSLLKTAKIYPKHKKGSLTKVENYRPISLVSTFSKIIEKVALKRMIEHLQKHELLTKHQHGFLKGRSATTALISLVESITDQLENNKLVTAVMVDYSKAFDCLGHDIILTKLANLGIKGNSLDWVASYLKGRQQVVQIQTVNSGKRKTYTSKAQPTTRGVPQGSVLGPFLFTLFTNDFPTYINKPQVETVMFADDTTLLINSTSTQELHSEIISTTDKTFEYCIQNDLAINPDKTTFINFSRRQDTMPEISGLLVEEETKLLGVTIDANLSWTPHINNLSKKLGSGIFVIRRMKWVGGLEIAKAAYFALMESHIRYSLAIWGGTTKQNLNKILMLQKKAIRALADLEPQESCKEAFKSLGILTVVCLYIHILVTHTYQQDFPCGNNYHQYNTRRAKDYVLPTHHTTQYSRKPSYMGRKLYNALPENLKNLDPQDLKKKLQKYLVERPLYTLEEYFTIKHN